MKTVFKWSAEQFQRLSWSRRKATAECGRIHTQQKVICFILRRMDELVEWYFQMSGFRVERLKEQGEMHCGKREKHLGNPQSTWIEPSCHIWPFFSYLGCFALIFSSLLFIDQFLPSRVESLHRSDAMTTFFCFLSLRLLGSTGIHRNLGKDSTERTTEKILTKMFLQKKKI